MKVRSFPLEPIVVEDKLAVLHVQRKARRLVAFRYDDTPATCFRHFVTALMRCERFFVFGARYPPGEKRQRSKCNLCD